jgi:hypothetical protein
MIEIIHPLEKYKYDTWRILSMKCYIDNFVRLRSCIRNVNTNSSTSPHPCTLFVFTLPSIDGSRHPRRRKGGSDLSGEKRERERERRRLGAVEK